MKTLTTILATLALSTTLALAADEEKKPAATEPAKEGAAQPAKPGDKPKRDPEEAFKKLDANTDGSVSLDEFKAGPMGKRAPDKVDEFFKAKDKDGDGKLSLDEFKAHGPRKDKAAK